MRTDNRGRWTLKHADLGPEFMALVKKAAERQGMTAGSFVVETLRERAHQILKGEGGPPPSPPARPEDVAGTLAEMITTMAATQEQLEAIRRETRRGRWRR